MTTLKLKHPIPLGKGQVSELNFRDHVIAEDYLAFDVYGGVAQAIRLIANVSGTDEAIVRKLHGVDYQAAKSHVDAMLAACEMPEDASATPSQANDTPGSDGAAANTTPVSEATKKP